MLKASLRIFRPHPNHRSPRNSPVSLFKENQMTNKLLLFVDCCWQKQKEYFLANVQRVSSFSAFCHHRQEENRTALEWMTLSSHRRFFFCSPTIQVPQNGSNDTQLPLFRCRHFSLSQLFMNLFHLPRCTSSVAPFCVEVHWLLALRLVLSTLSFGPSSLNFLISVWWQVCFFSVSRPLNSSDPASCGEAVILPLSAHYRSASVEKKKEKELFIFLRKSQVNKRFICRVFVELDLLRPFSDNSVGRSSGNWLGLRQSDLFLNLPPVPSHTYTLAVAVKIRRIASANAHLESIFSCRLNIDELRCQPADEFRG